MGDTPYDDFYCRLYQGHKGRYGHEFWEAQLMPNGHLRYINETSYKGDDRIKKEMRVSHAVLSEVKRMVQQSGIMEKSDHVWPDGDLKKEGILELEVKLGNEHICFVTIKIGSTADIADCEDNEGLQALYYLSQYVACVTQNPPRSLEAHP
mmetsp:Transcript_6579/g.18692  ORF Transcript_6579/g.18692 Transcript_6579/m.18692 type:complete len:151 (-) Transcript_6579:1256-1708(-)